ncbi:hypothetical protein KUTeg_021812 [Tegillarca granosa]|uniref:Acyl-CoA-binding domain-containing protein 6 n=1 Tax=Tegillarca granosa TaxID=220873 RepID=A0ABQ9E4G1_TEGGR|nr:hypothetical protein KUTeg_021812 [Tegillarca granosa]
MEAYYHDHNDLKELTELYERATTYVRQNSNTFDSEQLLCLYGRFKQVNEGPCNTKKPGLFDFHGKQKWEAWKKLGDMNKEEAMMEYVEYVSDTDPYWEEKINEGKTNTVSWNSVSTMSCSDVEIADENKTIFDWCKEGNTEQIKNLLSCPGGIDINNKDSDGMTLLHWACDRGYSDLVKLLLKSNADINAKDSDDQTALHYAVSCEHKDVVDILLSYGADKLSKDIDGSSPMDLETSSEIKHLLRTVGNS